MSVSIPFLAAVVQTSRLDQLPWLIADGLIKTYRGHRAEGLARWSAMSMGDLMVVVRELQALGLTVPRAGPTSDVAIAEMRRGLLAPSAWLQAVGEASGNKRLQLADGIQRGSEIPRKGPVTVTVEWGYELHSLPLTSRNWSRVIRGRALSIRGRGYRHEGEFFWDRWLFAGGLHGALTVHYGDALATGFAGALRDADITPACGGEVILR